MSYYNFPDIGRLLIALGVTILGLLPFAIWKFVEVIIWLFHHVKVTL